MNSKYLTAIVGVRDKSGPPVPFLKYRNILNRPAALGRFERFIRSKFPGMDHINYYDPLSRQFIRQTSLKGEN